MTHFKKLLLAVALLGATSLGTAAVASSVDTHSSVMCADDSSN